MIPVDDRLCKYIDFDTIEDKEYKDLLRKEYRFLKPLKETILKKADKLYNKQKNTGIVETCYCNFNILEFAYKEYCLHNETEE